MLQSRDLVLTHQVIARGFEFVVDWDSRRLSSRIAFGELSGAIAAATAPDAAERPYALRLVKQRLH